MFSERTGWPAEESGWARAVSAAKRRPALVDLSESNPTRCRFGFYRSALNSLADKKNLVYAPDPQGLAQARAAVSHYYRDRAGGISADSILLTAGTSEGYSYLLKLLLNPGETVLVPEPGYPLLDHLARLSDARLGRYPLRYEENSGWRIDRAAFERALTPDVRVVVVVHPNNPTGHRTSEADRAWLEEAASSRGASLISDEVFLDFSFDASREARSFAANRKALTFTLSGLSKVAGLPQMKLSWIAVSGPEGLAREALSRLSIIADAYLTVASPPQIALSKWLSDENLERVHDEINARLVRNRKSLEKALPDRAKLLKADGGWCALIRFQGPQTDEEMAMRLLEKDVLVQPGYLFDLPEHHLVLSLLPEPSVFNEGVRRLAGFLSG